MNIFKIAAVVAAASAALHANAATETFDSTPVFDYTGTGTLESAPIKNVTAMPTGSTGKWLSVYRDNFETVDFGAGFDTVSFLWGSVDYYNTVSFFSGTSEIASFSGYTAGKMYGIKSDGTTTIDFSYTSGTPITSLRFDTTGIAFEVDNITATSAVPEPETYALMLAGLGAMAFLARRRQS